MDEAEVNQIAQELLDLLAGQSIPVQYLSVSIGSPLRYIKSYRIELPNPEAIRQRCRRERVRSGLGHHDRSGDNSTAVWNA